MKEILLPGTELRTSRLGFGTASLHHALRSKDRQALLSAALDAGFTHFDTARLYGEGLAERALGRFLGHRRHQVTIATKFGIPAIRAFERFPPWLYAYRALGPLGQRLLPQLSTQRPRALSREAAEDSLSRSLKALRTDWIDLFLVHEPQASDLQSLLDLADWLERQKTSGRVRYLGLAGSVDGCLDIATQTSGLFDVLQVEDSLSGREADRVLAAGRPLQITFGYLRRSAGGPLPIDALSVIRSALARNASGLVLISSRQPARLRALATLAS